MAAVSIVVVCVVADFVVVGGVVAVVLEIGVAVDARLAVVVGLRSVDLELAVNAAMLRGYVQAGELRSSL